MNCHKLNSYYVLKIEEVVVWENNDLSEFLTAFYLSASLIS